MTTPGRRAFKLAASSGKTGGAILDAPTVSVFRNTSISKIQQDFEQQWGVKLEGIAIPACEPDGMLFHVEGLRDAKRSSIAEISAEYPGFGELAGAILSSGLDLVVTITPSLSFLQIPQLQLVDVLGSKASALCIGQERTQDILAAVLGSAIDIALQAGQRRTGRVVGAAIDITNLWPAGGKPGRLKANCFCDSCVAYFETVSPGLVKRFRTFPNPLSLMMRPNERGIGFSGNFDSATEVDEIVGLSKLHGYHEQFPGMGHPQLLDEAQTLRRYCRARHDQVIGSLDSVFEQASEGLDIGLRKILIAENEKYSWTSGTWLDLLDRPKGEGGAHDEIWFDVASGSGGLANRPYRAYLSSRSRYFISDFLRDCASASDPVLRNIAGIGRSTMEETRKMLLAKADRTAGVILGPQSLAGLPDDVADYEAGDRKGRYGFVVPALSSDMASKHVDQLPIPPSHADRMAQSQDQIQQQLAKLFGVGQMSSEELQYGADD